MVAENIDLSLKTTKAGDLHVSSQSGKDESSTDDAKKSNAVIFNQLDAHLNTLVKKHNHTTDEKDKAGSLGATNGKSKPKKADKKDGDDDLSSDDLEKLLNAAFDALTLVVEGQIDVQTIRVALMTALGTMSKEISDSSTAVIKQQSDNLALYAQYGNTDGIGDLNVRGKEMTGSIKREGNMFDVFDGKGNFVGQFTHKQLVDARGNFQNLLDKLKADSTGDLTGPGDGEEKKGYNDDHLNKIVDGDVTKITFTYYDTSQGHSYAPGGTDAIDNSSMSDDDKNTARSKFMAFLQAVQSNGQAATTQANTVQGVPTTMQQGLTQSLTSLESGQSTIISAIGKTADSLSSISAR
ncbi:MAG: hypothetical protein S4CHLAM20_07460 [Chlamydiia bacterium]|nr:hypothetical protein [Chlamydiia bacterium]